MASSLFRNPKALALVAGVPVVAGLGLLLLAPSLRHKLAAAVGLGGLSQEEQEYQRELLVYVLTVMAEKRILVKNLRRQVPRSLRAAAEAAAAAAASSSPPSSPSAATPTLVDTEPSDGGGSATAGTAVDPAVLSKGHKGYYFFNSKGERLPNKWDSFDVDEELERLEQEESGVAPTPRSRGEPEPPAALLRQVQQASVDVEQLLTDSIDELAGDTPEAKAQRKRLVAEAHDLLSHLDALAAQLKPDRQQASSSGNGTPPCTPAVAQAGGAA